MQKRAKNRGLCHNHRIKGKKSKCTRNTEAGSIRREGRRGYGPDSEDPYEYGDHKTYRPNHPPLRVKGRASNFPRTSGINLGSPK